MAITVTHGFQFMLEVIRKEHDVEDDVLKIALMGTTYAFDAATHKAWDASAWVGSTAYSVDNTVKPTVENGYIYRATVAGTSGSSEPSWPTTIGNTVVDGGVTWECWSVNVSESEIADGYGYTAGGETLTNVVASKGSGQVDIAADSVTWTASGGPIPTVGSAVIYNSSHVNNTIYKCIDFGADYDTADGKLFQINLTNGLGYLAEAA